MEGIRKSLFVLPCAAVVLAGCLSVDTRSPDPSDTPQTTSPPVVTETVTAPPVTETVTRPAPTTAETIRPSKPAGCTDQGMNTDDWDVGDDTPTRRELELAGGDPVTQPMVDAPLVNVSAWTGPCFDTVMFTIDTTMNEPEHSDLPWFIGGYRDEVTTEGQGALVALDGNGDLQLTVFAKAASFVHSSGHVPPGLVNASGFYRDMGANFGAITEVKGAGEQHGQFTFGIGVDEERPFAVHFADDDGKTAVVVRVANR